MLEVHNCCHILLNAWKHLFRITLKIEDSIFRRENYKSFCYKEWGEIALSLKSFVACVSFSLSIKCYSYNILVLVSLACKSPWMNYKGHYYYSLQSKMWYMPLGNNVFLLLLWVRKREQNNSFDSAKILEEFIIKVDLITHCNFLCLKSQ